MASTENFLHLYLLQFADFFYSIILSPLKIYTTVLKFVVKL